MLGPAGDGSVIFLCSIFNYSMALTKQEIWDAITPLVEAEGLALFDLVPSPGGHGAMQVFITTGHSRVRARSIEAAGESSPGAAKNGVGHKNGSALTVAEKSGVDVEDCARVSRRILELENIEEILPGAAELQVSSPGINRKLSRSEHFSAAVGERLKVTLRDQAGSKRSVRGLLQKFDGTTLWLQLDKDESPNTGEFCVALSQVDAARVDFVF